MYVIQSVTTAYEVDFSGSEQIAFDLSRKNVASNLQGLKKTLFIFFHICFFHLLLLTNGNFLPNFKKKNIFLYLVLQADVLCPISIRECYGIWPNKNIP